MAVEALGVVGTASVKSSGTSISCPTSFVVPAGSMIVLAYGSDNTEGGAGPTLTAISVPAGETAAWEFVAGFDAATTGVSNGVKGEMQRIKTTVDWPADHTTALTLSGAVIAKNVVMYAWSGVEATMRSTPGALGVPNGVAGGVSTSGVEPVAGDLVVAMQVEESTASEGDTDTFQGAWVGYVHVNTSGGSSTTNMATAFEHKIVTGPGHQSHSQGTAGDRGAVIASFQPAATGPPAPPPASAFAAFGIPL